MAGSLLRPINSQNHRGQEGRLRTREVVGAVGVQYPAVVLDLEQEIVHHALSKIEPVIAEKSHDYEVAVPAIHFIKSSAGDDVTILEIEQSGRRNCGRTGFSQPIAGGRKIPHLDFTPGLELLHRFRFGEVRGKVELRGASQFRVAKGGTVRQRPRQSVPPGRDIGTDRFEAGA